MIPDEIIGNYNMPLFKKHLEIVLKNGAEYPGKRLEKEFSKPELAFIARKHDELAAAGFVVDRISEQGEVKWFVIAESPSWRLFKHGEIPGVESLDRLKQMPEESLMQMGRAIYRKMMAEKQIDNQ